MHAMTNPSFFAAVISTDSFRFIQFPLVAQAWPTETVIDVLCLSARRGRATSCEVAEPVNLNEASLRGIY